MTSSSKRRRALVAAVLLSGVVVVGACSSGTTAGPPPSDAVADLEPSTTTAPETTEVAPTASAATTPLPDTAQSKYLTDTILVAYPAIAERPDKIPDWARDVCQQILSGDDEAALLWYIPEKFSGGSRADPTATEAVAILEAVRSSGFCVAP